MVKLGTAFSDSLVIERSVASRFPKGSVPSWWLGAGRALLFVSVYCLLFFVLIWRLFDLTVINGHKYRMLADGNRIRELIRHAPRGLLLDRTGKPLVANLSQYRLITPCEAPGQTPCVRRLSQEEGEAWRKRGLPAGDFLEVDYVRQYLYPDILAHVVGYTGELTAEELREDYYTLRHYRLGDQVGRVGAEAVFEERLRGRDGRELVEIDATGKILRTLGRDEEIPGENIVLPVDLGLSQAAQQAFPGGYKGAIVVTKPTTGEVLVLYSSPVYDPNQFSQGMSAAAYRQLLDDPDRPMFNRAAGGNYPPGSTFKIVTALAGLEEKAISKETLVEDVGVITIGPFSFPNWYFIQYGRTEGMVDVVRAISRSNDIFFYKTGEWLGISKLAKWARLVGVGKPLGIEIGAEAAGLVPDPDWKNRTFTSPADREARNNEWYLGDTYHVAIGQGYLLTTPLQVNTWTNVIGSGGKLCRPTIQKSPNPKSLLNRQAGKNQNCKDLGIKKETITLITEGLKRACDPGGTGWPLFNFTVTRTAPETGNSEWSLSPTPVSATSKRQVPVACKTGTAEFGDAQNRTHAWFTAFAPLPADYVSKQSENNEEVVVGEPEISVTVLVEGAGEGSNVAAPVAKKIFEAWFSR